MDYIRLLIAIVIVIAGIIGMISIGILLVYCPIIVLLIVVCVLIYGTYKTLEYYED